MIDGKPAVEGQRPLVAEFLPDQRDRIDVVGPGQDSLPIVHDLLEMDGESRSGGPRRRR